MPCYHPLHGYASKTLNPTGKRSTVFKLSHAISAAAVTVPCGRCIGCRLELSRQWALRCMHEAQLHSQSCFITLTYARENRPYGDTLKKKDFQDFMKRVRKKCGKLSYYHCGEYGEKCAGCEQSRKRCKCAKFEPVRGHPHYHALLFGLDFSDKVFFKNSADGSKIYTSAILEQLWPHGFSTVGALTFESAAYCARYTTTKLNFGKEYNYEFINVETGEVTPVQPEYTTMSLNPAIAKNWFATFKSDVYPSDSCVLRGKEMKPPKYYDRLLEAEDPEARAAMKTRRLSEALLRTADATTARLRVREQCKLAQIKQLKRGIE